MSLTLLTLWLVGHAAGVQPPPPPPPNRVIAWLRKPDSWIEIGASTFTLAGMFIGSTTIPGAVCYLISLVFWYALCYRKKLHGIIPLNVASTFVAAVNIWRAL
jgi:hypothetical protein